MKLVSLFFLLNIVFAASNIVQAQRKPMLADYVNPYIGVLDDESYCTVGPQLPFGSVNPGPQTVEGGNDGYSFYESIRGFAQLHVSGTGWGKYGQFLISPQIGLAVGENKHDSPKSDEAAKAYYYSVNLLRYGIKTEFTPTNHAVIYRFTFPKSTEASILIDITHSLTRDIATQIGGQVSAGDVKIDTVSNNKIIGHGRYSGGFGEGEYEVYFCAKFSRPYNNFGVWKDYKKDRKDHMAISNPNERIGAYVGFQTSEQEAIYLKIAISLKSSDQAEIWLDGEIPDWDFETVKLRAQNSWNRELGKILVEGGSERDKTLFYSAMFRSMMMPRDRTNDIKGWPEDAPLWDDHYAVWDTWRTMFPLMTIIKPEVVRDNINSFIERFKKNKVVKDAFIAGSDMFQEQGGNNIDNIIGDAFVKKIPGVDWEKAYELLKYDADNERLGHQKGSLPNQIDTMVAGYKKRGWIPGGIMSCSMSLEYSYNDFCVAQVAKGLGKKADFNTYFKRSQLWSELWNPNLESRGFKGYIGPRKTNGEWINIDPAKNWGSWGEYFYEGSSWTYSYFAPQDFPKLIKLSGGSDLFCQRLIYGLSQRLIDYRNEPAFLAIHAFHYANRPDLASYWVKKMMSEGYTDEGYPGNEDSGAMGSWYVFAALGIFPNAGQPLYFIHGPSFSRITVTLGNHKTLLITANGLSKENSYVKACSLNGKTLNGSFISHEQIMAGGKLDFTMGPDPKAN